MITEQPQPTVTWYNCQKNRVLNIPSRENGKKYQAQIFLTQCVSITNIAANYPQIVISGISTIHMIILPAEANDSLHNPGLYNLAPTRPGKITAGQANKLDYVLK